jgi:hypothetical protein
MSARLKAAELGQIRYSTGAPCKRGHLSERYTSTGGCVECLRLFEGGFSAKLAAKRIEAIQGLFKYPLHPQDVPAALAYCQALDLQRGRSPHVPAAAPAPRDEAAVYAQIAAHRERVAGSLGTSPDFLSSLPTGVLNFPTNGS